MGLINIHNKFEYFPSPPEEFSYFLFNSRFPSFLSSSNGIKRKLLTVDWHSYIFLSPFCVLIILSLGIFVKVDMAALGTFPIQSNASRNPFFYFLGKYLKQKKNGPAQLFVSAYVPRTCKTHYKNFA